MATLGGPVDADADQSQSDADLSTSTTGIAATAAGGNGTLGGRSGMGMGMASRGLDLSAHVAPPKSVLLQCRCVRQYGEFECADGSLLFLTKGSEHLLPRIDCEPLMRAGFLVQLQAQAQ